MGNLGGPCSISLCSCNYFVIFSISPIHSIGHFKNSQHNTAQEGNSLNGQSRSPPFNQLVQLQLFFVIFSISPIHSIGHFKKQSTQCSTRVKQSEIQTLNGHSATPVLSIYAAAVIPSSFQFAGYAPLVISKTAPTMESLHRISCLRFLSDPSPVIAFPCQSGRHPTSGLLEFCLNCWICQNSYVDFSNC